MGTCSVVFFLIQGSCTQKVRKDMNCELPMIIWAVNIPGERNPRPGKAYKALVLLLRHVAGFKLLFPSVSEVLTLFKLISVELL